MSDGSEPVADHEILYRRIPATSGFYDPRVDPNPSPLAFRPTQLDTTGLSLSRAKYKLTACHRIGRPLHRPANDAVKPSRAERFAQTVHSELAARRERRSGHAGRVAEILHTRLHAAAASVRGYQQFRGTRKTLSPMTLKKGSASAVRRGESPHFRPATNNGRVVFSSSRKGGESPSS